MLQNLTIWNLQQFSITLQLILYMICNSYANSEWYQCSHTRYSRDLCAQNAVKSMPFDAATQKVMNERSKHTSRAHTLIGNQWRIDIAHWLTTSLKQRIGGRLQHITNTASSKMKLLLRNVMPLQHVTAIIIESWKQLLKDTLYSSCPILRRVFYFFSHSSF